LAPTFLDILAGLAIAVVGIGCAVWLLSVPPREAARGSFMVSQRQTVATDMTCAVAAGIASSFAIDGFTARFAIAGTCLTDPHVADAIDRLHTDCMKPQMNPRTPRKSG
jgi:hypothetical protein